MIKIEAAWARGSGEVPAAAGPMTHLYPGDVVGDRPWNREISFNKLNRNKRSVTLELDSARGRELFLRLAETADVVIDNYSPRVMGKLGSIPRASTASIRASSASACRASDRAARIATGSRSDR